MDQCCVSAVIRDLQKPDEVLRMLGQFGAQVEAFQTGDLTIIVNQERSMSARGAMAAFMRRLESLRLSFEYIAIGDARDAIVGYHHALADLDSKARFRNAYKTEPRAVTSV